MRNQLLNTIDPQRIEALRDRNDIINIPINGILNYLIQIHGQISEEECMLLEDEVKEFSYELSLAVDILK